MRCCGTNWASPIPARVAKRRPSRRLKNRRRSIPIGRGAQPAGRGVGRKRRPGPRRKGIPARACINPDLPDALGNLGHLLAVRRELPRQPSTSRSSVRLKPNDAEVRTNYAVTLAWLNRFDEARRQIDAAVKVDPKSPEAHNVRGSLLQQSGDQAEALGEFLEAIRLRPDFGVAHIHAALLLAARGDRAAAEQHLRLAAAGDDSSVRRQAADTLRQLGFHQ